MALIVPLFILLMGTSINDYNSGGVENADQAIEKIKDLGTDSIKPENSQFND